MKQSRAHAARARNRTVASSDRGRSCPPRRLSRPIRLGFLGILLAATVAQAVDFQITFWREGPKRLYDFDVPYKPLYDRAVAQPQRPIYLENGNGVPLTWMRIGTPLWKAGLYPSLFAFPMGRSLHWARSSSAQTQTARTARLSRKAALSMSFTGRSSRKRLGSTAHNHCSGSIDSLTM